MAEPVVCVNWNNHANNLTTTCKTFLDSNFCMDCTLAAEGKSLKAHRLILSACSPYFHMLFSQIREDHPIVIFGDTLFCTLKTVIEFVYYGKVDIPASQFEAFLELAVSLQIKGLNNYSRKDRKTDIGDNAGGNACQCAATVNSTLMSNEDSFSNSSRLCQFHLPHDCTASMQVESFVSFERHDCDSCEILHSEAILIPLQDHQSPVHNDPELSISPETCVKSDPLYSENETVDTKIEVLDQQICSVHNDPEGFNNTEISVKREQLHFENGTFDVQNNVLDSGMQDGNFESVVSDRLAPSIVQNLDEHSNNRESLHVKDNSASVFQLEQQQEQLKQHEQEQLPCQQPGQHQQLHQQITHLPCEENSPRLAVQCDTLLPQLLVPVSGEVEDAESQESDDDNDVPGNDAVEMDEPTLEKKFSPCSSAECILPDEEQTTQQRNGRRRRPRDCNSFPSPLEQQLSAAEEACSQPGIRVHLNHSTTRGLPNLSDVCGKTFKTSKNLDCHKRTHIECSYSCNICAKTFSRSCSLTAHKRLHSGERPYVCGNAFSHPSKLNQHMRTHTGDRPYSCDVCGKAFSLLDYLKKHMRTHSGERPYSCDVCGKAFSLLGTLKQHMRTHSGERPYSCDVCGKAFSQLSHLNSHMRTHTGDRPYSCDVCGKAFSRLDALKKHMRTHSGERPYSCDVCGKAFSLLGNRIKHLRTHTDRPYSCDVCGKAFSRLDDLEKHMRTHTGDRPYSCDVCGKAFSKLDDLKRHMRTHSGERPYACDVCGKALSLSSDLKKHMRTHTGERPYLCDVCGKAFSQSSHLNSHMRTHT